MKWILALAIAVGVLWLRRDRRTPEEKLRAAYLNGDRRYLEEHLPHPTVADFNPERVAESLAEENLDREEDGLKPFDFDAEFRKAYFRARVEAYRKANPDLPWRN